MPDDTISPGQLSTCLLKASAYLEHNYDILNNLNVFPVPDGDTGTNMLSTFEAGCKVLWSTDIGTIEDIGRRLNLEMIKHSRGNSGFIIARFFHGFFEALGPLRAVTTDHLATGFNGGLFQVNSSLFSPVEGTMVTIIRTMTERLKTESSSTPLVALASSLKAARTTLNATPSMLPVLAKAGVVDSGALGFIFLMEGFLRGLADEPVIRETEAAYRFTPDPNTGGIALDTREFKYCTEINVIHVYDVSRSGISEFLEERGNSIALVCEDDFLKVHIHTDTPGDVIDYMKSIGTVENVKVDNLVEQISRFSAAEDPDAECAVLAFIPGEGFRSVFDSLGVHHCILYTEHLPSTGEITEYLQGLEEKNIIILPNNNNILPVVTAAAEKSDKYVSVVHTEDIIQGIAAAYGFSGNDGVDENAVNMKDCKDMARGLYIYKSTTTSEFDGCIIQPGDYFSLFGGNLAARGKNLNDVVGESLGKAGAADCANITIYYRDTDILKVLSELDCLSTGHNESLEIEYLPGGQFRESLIISLE